MTFPSLTHPALPLDLLPCHLRPPRTQRAQAARKPTVTEVTVGLWGTETQVHSLLLGQPPRTASGSCLCPQLPCHPEAQVSSGTTTVRHPWWLGASTHPPGAPVPWGTHIQVTRQLTQCGSRNGTPGQRGREGRALWVGDACLHGSGLQACAPQESQVVGRRWKETQLGVQMAHMNCATTKPALADCPSLGSALNFALSMALGVCSHSPYPQGCEPWPEVKTRP